jgi:hypothetical protein
MITPFLPMAILFLNNASIPTLAKFPLLKSRNFCNSPNIYHSTPPAIFLLSNKIFQIYRIDWEIIQHPRRLDYSTLIQLPAMISCLLISSSPVYNLSETSLAINKLDRRLTNADHSLTIPPLKAPPEIPETITQRGRR